MELEESNRNPSEITTVAGAVNLTATEPLSALEPSTHEDHHTAKAHDGKTIGRTVGKKSKASKKSQRKNNSEKAQRRTASSRSLRRRSSTSKLKDPPNRSIPVIDAAPERIVNPLLEMPSTNVSSQDLWAELDLTFVRPDTYSLAYLARLLGWNVPANKSTAPVTWNPSAVELDMYVAANDPVPPEGSRRIWNDRTDTSVDDTYNLPAMVDPLFEALVHPTRTVALHPTTPAQLAKRVASCAPLAQSVVDLAVQHGLLGSDECWSCHTIAEYRAANAELQWIVPPTVCGLLLVRANVPVGMGRYNYKWYPTSADASEMVLTMSDIVSENRSLLREGLTETERALLVVLTALVLEHARLSRVCYALLRVPVACRALFQTYFRMTMVVPQFAFNTNDDTSGSHVDMVCDLSNCSTRLAFFRFKESTQSVAVTLETKDVSWRWLARMPGCDEVKAAMQSTTNVSFVPTEQGTDKKSRDPKDADFCFTSASPNARQSAVNLRVRLSEDGGIQSLSRLDSVTNAEHPFENAELSSNLTIDLMRGFKLPKPPHKVAVLDDESQIFFEHQRMQTELEALEQSFRPKIISLTNSAVEERFQYESNQEAIQHLEEKQLVDEYKRKLHHRKELDLAWQKQLEQDMDAVCEICNDGEVTPGNQILFCEGKLIPIICFRAFKWFKANPIPSRSLQRCCAPDVLWNRANP
jgi:hypothetical protein